ncbi:MAG: hypothetical protein ABIK33_06460, partial [candidate division WOR-3 bacterium]
MRKIILILLIGVIVIAYANIADNLGGNKLRTKPQLTSSGGMWIGHPKMSNTKINTLKQNAKATITRENAVSEFLSVMPAAKMLENQRIINPAPLFQTEDTIYYDGANAGGVGYGTQPGTWYGAVRFTTVIPCSVKAAIFYHWDYPSPIDPSYIYICDAGTTTQPGSKLDSVPYTPNPNNWIRVNFPNAVYRSAGQDFWVVVKIIQTAGGFPLGCDAGPSVSPARSFYSGDMTTWYSWPSLGINRNANLRAIVKYMPSAANDMSVISILNVPEITTPYQRYPITAVVKNLGTNSQQPGVPVKLRITGPTGTFDYEYNDVEYTTQTLEQYASENVIFVPDWIVPESTGIYTIKCWTELAEDEVPSNDTATFEIEVTNWLTYANWENPRYFVPYGPEKAMLFIPSEFGVLHPVVIESLKTQFYLSSTRPWNDSIFRFKIYATDGTLLYVSDTLRADSSWHIETYAVEPPLTIPSGSFYVAVCPRSDSHPSILADNQPVGRSFYGSPGEKSWVPYTIGEFFISTFVSWQPRNNDVGPYAMVEPLSMVAPNVAMTPKVVIKNYGFNNQPSIPVVMEIYDQSKALVYTGTGSIALNSGDTGTVALTPQWTPGAHGTVYDITVYTALPTDENPANDTGYTFTSAFTITRNMYSNLTSTPPTIDGDIQETEWSDANQYDVSDVLGQASGYPYRA